MFLHPSYNLNMRSYQTRMCSTDLIRVSSDHQQPLIRPLKILIQVTTELHPSLIRLHTSLRRPHPTSYDDHAIYVRVIYDLQRSRPICKDLRTTSYELIRPLYNHHTSRTELYPIYIRSTYDLKPKIQQKCINTCDFQKIVSLLQDSAGCTSLRTTLLRSH